MERLERKEQLQKNLKATREKIEQIARRAGRADVPELLPVTKFHPISDLEILYELGVGDVAENREQEARTKAEHLPGMRIHMIGQIQTKKANHVTKWAASVHSVDSEKLAVALNRGMHNAGREEKLPVYIQVSADADESRGGIPYAGLAELVDAIECQDRLKLVGLMVVPPLNTDAGEVFAAVRKLCDELSQQLGRPMGMSAGMSADMEAAILAGSNVVRVGTGIMGPRP